MQSIFQKKESILFIVLAGIFITNALIAELIGGKIFSLEDTLNIAPVTWSLLGNSGTLQFTAGTLLWPVVFLMTDVINEYYGHKGVRFLSYLTIILIGYSFIMLYAAMGLSPADFWITSKANSGVPNLDHAFNAVFGQGLLIIVGSMFAFLVGQVLDVLIFQKIKKYTGEKKVWLRATGSTVISQFFDSFVVLYIAFVGGPAITGFGEPWPFSLFIAVGLIGYFYKVILAFLLTPFIYLTHAVLDKYLGLEKANKMKKNALQ